MNSIVGMSRRGESGMLRALGATGLVIVSGALSAGFVFSDLGPNEGTMLRFAASAAVALLAGLAFGRLMPRVWYLGVMTSWGALLLGMIALVLRFTRPSDDLMWAMTLGYLALPFLSWCGSYLGARRTRRSSDGSAG
jgi:hypothetical protein